MWSTAPLESPLFVDFDGVAPHNRALRIIRQRAKHVKNKPTLRRRRVESFGQAAKTDASHSEFLDGFDQLLHRTRQTLSTGVAFVSLPHPRKQCGRHREPQPGTKWEDSTFCSAG